MLPFLLPAPPKRGVKKQRLSPAAVADLLFSDIKVMNSASIASSASVVVVCIVICGSDSKNFIQ